MSKFYVSVSTTITTTVCIEAESEEKAATIAENLANEDDAFADMVADGLAQDVEGYFPRYWDFEVEGTAPEHEIAANE